MIVGILAYQLKIMEIKLFITLELLLILLLIKDMEEKVKQCYVLEVVQSIVV